MAELKFLSEFGKAFVPNKLFGRPIRRNLHQYLISAGYTQVPYGFFGLMFILTAVITYFIFIPLIVPAIQGAPLTTVFLGAFFGWFGIQIVLVAIIMIFIYFFLNIKIYKRTKKIEHYMPDFLTFVSTNLKGGLSLEQALWAAIRPEFDLLAEEMTIVSKRVMTGNDLGDALEEFVRKYPSATLRTNMHLIMGEIEGGGRIVEVIDKVIQTMKKTRALKNEMSAATVTYMIFIGVVVVLISPALFALSFQLLQIIIDFTQNLGNSLGGTSGPVKGVNFDVQISLDDFRTFSIMALATIGICSSLIISIIEKGDMKGGLKYIPAFTISSIVLYLIFMVILANVFGGVF